MPAIAPSTIHAIYTRAISEELGLVVFTTNPTYLAEMLYRNRKEFANPAFADIAIIKPGSGDRLFLAKKSAELEA